MDCLQPVPWPLTAPGVSLSAASYGPPIPSPGLPLSEAPFPKGFSPSLPRQTRVGSGTGPRTHLPLPARSRGAGRFLWPSPPAHTAFPGFRLSGSPLPVAPLPGRPPPPVPLRTGSGVLPALPQLYVFGSRAPRPPPRPHSPRSPECGDPRSARTPAPPPPPPPPAETGGGAGAGRGCRGAGRSEGAGRVPGPERRALGAG